MMGQELLVLVNIFESLVVELPESEKKMSVSRCGPLERGRIEVFADKQYLTIAGEPFGSRTVDGNMSISPAPVYTSNGVACCLLAR